MLWWTKRKLRSKNRKTRLDAVRELERLGATGELLELANSDVGRDALLALVRIGDKRAIEPLISKCDTGFNSDLLEGIVAFGVAAIDPLTNRIEGNGANRFNAIRALYKVLSKTPDKRVTPLLIKVINSDDEIAKEAAHCLGIIGDERAVNPLREILMRPLRSGWQDGELKKAIRLALARLGDPDGLYQLVFYSPDHNGYGAEAKATVIGLGSPAVPHLLRKLTIQGLHLVVVEEICDILERIGNESCARPLVELARSGDYDVPGKAIQALAGVIKRHLAVISDDDLQIIANLDYINDTRIMGERDSVWEKLVPVDCSAIRNAARQELNRRGA